MGTAKIHNAFCTSVLRNAETPCPRVSCVRVFECEVRVFECETVHIFSLSDLIGIPRGSEGTFATRRASQVKFTTNAPIIPPTGSVERTLFLGPNVGTLVTFLLAWVFSDRQASVFAQRALPGRGVVSWILLLLETYCRAGAPGRPHTAKGLGGKG